LVLRTQYSALPRPAQTTDSKDPRRIACRSADLWKKPTDRPKIRAVAKDPRCVSARLEIPAISAKALKVRTNLVSSRSELRIVSIHPSSFRLHPSRAALKMPKMTTFSKLHSSADHPRPLWERAQGEGAVLRFSSVSLKVRNNFDPRRHSEFHISSRTPIGLAQRSMSAQTNSKWHLLPTNPADRPAAIPNSELRIPNFVRASTPRQAAIFHAGPKCRGRGRAVRGRPTQSTPELFALCEFRQRVSLASQVSFLKLENRASGSWSSGFSLRPRSQVSLHLLSTFHPLLSRAAPLVFR
jgi:hypothetical protein